MLLSRFRVAVLCAGGLSFLNTPAVAQYQVGAEYGLASYIDSYGDKHTFFIDTNDMVAQVWGNGSNWQFQEINFVQYPEPTHKWLSAFVDSLGTHHVIFIDNNQHVDQLFYNGRWNYQDLTASSGAPATLAYSPLAGVADISGGQHVFFLDSNFNVETLYYVGGPSWHFENLTASGQGVTSQENSITAVFDSSQIQRVYYIGNAIDELLYSGGPSWKFQVPSREAPDSCPISPGSAIASLSSGNQQFISYFDPSGGVCGLHFDGNSWSAAVISAGQVGDDQSGLSIFSDQAGTHFLYSSASSVNNRHVHQVINGTDQDLTAMAGGNPIVGGATGGESLEVVSSLSSADGEYVFYIDTSFDLDLLYYSFSTHTWSHQLLVTFQY